MAKAPQDDGLSPYERFLVFNMLHRERIEDMKRLEKNRELSSDELVEYNVLKEKFKQFFHVQKARLDAQFAAFEEAVRSQQMVENAVENSGLRKDIFMTDEERIFWAIENDSRAKQAIEMMNAEIQMFAKKDINNSIKYPSDLLNALAKTGFKAQFMTKHYPNYWTFDSIDHRSPVYEKRLDSYIRELEHILERTYEQAFEGMVTHKDFLVLNAITGLYAQGGFVKEFIPRLFVSPAFNFVRKEAVIVDGSEIYKYENVESEFFDAAYDYLREGKDNPILDESITPPKYKNQEALQDIYESAKEEIIQKVSSLKAKPSIF